jgi:hypothetical protein
VLADSFVIIGIPRHLDAHVNKALLVVTLRNVNNDFVGYEWSPDGVPTGLYLYPWEPWGVLHLALHKILLGN